MNEKINFIMRFLLLLIRLYWFFILVQKKIYNNRNKFSNLNKNLKIFWLIIKALPWKTSRYIISNWFIYELSRFIWIKLIILNLF